MSKLNIYDVANGNNNTNRNTNTTYFKKDNYNDNTVNCKIRTSKKSYTGVSGFISFAYNPRLVNLVKCAPERWWNATTKEWEVPDKYLDKILESIEKAGFTVLKVDERSPEDIYNIQSFKPQIEIPSDYAFKTKPWGEFQLDGVIRGINEDKFILGDDQGCISGECEVCVTNAESKASMKMKLRNLFKNFHDPNSRFYHNLRIKSLIDGRFRYYDIKDVVYSGKKSTIKIYVNDTFISCTHDHLIYTPQGWIEAGKLKVGDTVFTNGKLVCPYCGSTENIITYPYAKYYGYCRSCMYKYKRDGTLYKGEEIHKKINKDGYVVLYSKTLRHLTNYHCGILEHIYVYEQNTNTTVDTDIYVIHHKNGIKTDNRFENLQLLTKFEHDKLHSDTKRFHLYQFNPNITEIQRGNTTIYLVPQESHITKIEEDVIQDVYDIKLDNNEGIHNFVCNNFIVHNCGKSWQALQIACIRKKMKGIKHCLVICCVNPNKYNWMDEVEEHTFEKGYILGTRYRKKSGKAYIGSNEDKLADLENMNDCFFQITNIETLRYTKNIKVTTKHGAVKNKTIYPIADKLEELINKSEIGYIIVDEIHVAKDSHSQQGKALLTLSKCDNVLMSGTLLLNSPVDLFTPLKMVNAETHSLTQFKQHYCVFGGFGGHQIVSYKNLGELQMLLNNVMLRRMKKDVLDLPPKVHTIKYVELAKDQQAIYDEIKEQTIADIEAYHNRTLNIDKVSNKMTPLSMLIRMRQATGNPNILTSKKISNAKFDMLKLLAEELVANGEKFIVFSNFTMVLNDAFKVLCNIGLKPALYTGENLKDREKEKARFKTFDDCKCICGTIGAMGTGITLTEATTVIFLDEPWNRATKDQAEDRCYRIGTKSSINIITLIAKGTIDEKIHDVVYKKGKMSDIIVDKEVDAVSNEAMVQYLLS